MGKSFVSEGDKKLPDLLGILMDLDRIGKGF